MVTRLSRGKVLMGSVGVGGSNIVKVTLNAVDTPGGLFNWQAPVNCIVNRIIVDVTTKATAACTVDIGTTAVSATTSNDGLIDGLDVGTAAILADNLGNAGTNGKPRQKVAQGKWVTGSMATGATAGIVGSAYITYQEI